MNEINYEKLYRLGLCNAENYKQELTIKKKIASTEISKLDKTIKSRKKRLRELIEKYQNDIDQSIANRKEYKELVKEVDSEYSYRKKIAHLLKKYDYLEVEFLGDEDVFTTWIYSDDFNGDIDYEGDPFKDHHFCDSYKEAYERCLDYIKHHENYINKRSA